MNKKCNFIFSICIAIFLLIIATVLELIFQWAEFYKGYIELSALYFLKVISKHDFLFPLFFYQLLILTIIFMFIIHFVI